MKKASLKGLKKSLCTLLAAVLAFSSVPMGIVFGSTTAEYQNLAEGASYVYNQAPHASYWDRMGNTMTDGYEPTYNGEGWEEYDQSLWVGWNRNDPAPASFTIDLGELCLINKVGMRLINATSVGIKYPHREITFSYSTEETGDDFTLWHVTKPIDANEAPTDSSERFEWDVEEKEVRRIKVDFNNLKVLTTDPAWFFVGEVFAWGEGVRPARPEFLTDLNETPIVCREGQSFTLTTEAIIGDNGDLTYQWYKGTLANSDAPLYTATYEAIPGATDATYTVTDADPDQSGYYFVIAKNTKGDFSKTVKSRICGVTVKARGSDAELPVITTDLVAGKERLVEGDNLVLSVGAESIDDGALTYKWYKNGTEITGAESDTLTIEDVALEDGGEYYVKVTNTVGQHNKSLDSSVCEVIVRPASINLLPPVIDTDLNASEDLYFKDTLTLAVEASISNGVGGLSYQWYKDGVAIEGETSDTYTVAEAWVKDSGVYYVEVINTESGYDAVTKSTECTVTVTPDDGANLIADEKYTIATGGFHKTYKDADYEKLTDGIVASTYNDGKAVGYEIKSSKVVLEFEFDTYKYFKEIQIGALENIIGSTKVPGRLYAEALISGKWVKVSDALIKGKGEGRKDIVLSVPDDVAIRAKGLRFTFSNTMRYVFLDEVTVTAEYSGKTADGDLVPSIENNLALGKKYTVSESTGGNYTDANGEELTNGVVATNDKGYSDDAWSGYNAKDSAGQYKPVEFAFDLGEEVFFEELRANFCCNSKNGIRPSQNMEVYYSNDNLNWTLAATDAISPVADGNFIYEYALTLKEAVMGRYVKVIMQPNGWMFVDEVEILAKSESTVNMPTNNIARGVDYTSTATSANYTDNSGKDLTDGNRGGINVLEGWVGYDSDAEIVLDLDAVSDFKQVDLRFLKNADNGIEFPEEVEVSVSADGSSFGNNKVVDVTGSGLDAKVSVTWPDGVSAQYVKVEFPVTGTVLIDEIEVLKEQTVFNQTPDSYVNDNNIAAGKEYVTSWDATQYPDTNGTELTDGIRGTDYYKHQAWSEYEEKSYEEEASDGSSYTRYEDFTVTVDLGSVQSFEQVQLGTLKGIGYSSVINNPKAVKVEYSSDNTNWALFSEEEMATLPEGINRFNFFADTAVSGRYVKVTVKTNGNLFLDEVSVYRDKIPHGDDDLNPDAGQSYNAASGKAYTYSRHIVTDGTVANYYRPADFRNVPGILTDGLYLQTGTKYDNNWTGFKADADLMGGSYSDVVSYVFDLETAYSVEKVIVSSKNDTTNGLTTPKNLAVYASLDGSSWAKVANIANDTSSGAVQLTWDGTDGFNSKEEDATKVYTRFVKVEFETSGNTDKTVCLDEVKIIGKKGRTSDASETKPDGEYNIALNHPYVSVPDHERSQTDPDMKKLTDGVRATTDLNDPAWVRYIENYKTDENDIGTSAILQTIFFEFDEEKYITSISMTAIGNGSQFRHPWGVYTYGSMDGEKWFPIGRSWNTNRLWSANITDWGWRVELPTVAKTDLVADYSAVKTKYIRIDAEIEKILSVDEIEIYGYDADTVPSEIKDKSIEANGGRKLAGFDTEGNVYNPAFDAEPQGYLAPAEDTTNGAKDMILCYNGYYKFNDATGTYRGSWNADRYRTYLTYVDTDNNVVDTMFDTVCLLGMRGPGNRVYNQAVGDYPIPPTFSDWEWYLNKTFRDGGDVDELAKAAEIAAEELGNPDYKVKLVVMHPGIDRRATNFGPINGKYGDLKVTNTEIINGREFWMDAMDWWFDEVINRYEERKALYEAETGKEYPVEFVGFYHLGEEVGFVPAPHIYFNSRIKEINNELGTTYKSYWIPFNFANGIYYGEDVGYEVVALQPNHFFDNPYEIGGRCEVGNNWIDVVARMTNYANIGIEMEMDDRVSTDAARYNLWLDYLNGVTRNKMDGDNAFRAWYQAVNALRVCALSNNSIARSVYDYSYQLMKGEYEIKEHIENFDSARYIDNKIANKGAEEGTPSGSGGGAFYEPTGSAGAVETIKPSEEGYAWITGTNGYRLKDAEGNYVTGWAKVNDEWYYLDADGYMTTGWVETDDGWYYLNPNGAMATGWEKVGNIWYYLKGDGLMKTGWLNDGGKWYYLQSWGGMASGEWLHINNEWYYFQGNGAMVTGWFKDGNLWYFLEDSGAMATGWKLDEGKWYFLLPNGQMATNTTIDGYKVGADGAMF